MIRVEVTIKDGATVSVKRLENFLQHPLKLNQAGGQAVVVGLQKHFLSRNSEPNARGWKKQNFWSKEGRARTALVSVSDEGATVGVASPAIAHKLRGGTIRPKRGKYLAIPLTAAAYAAGSPREGGMELSFIPARPGHAAMLATRTALKTKTVTTKQRGRHGSGDYSTSSLVTTGGELVPQYLLVRSVTHQADPRTLPPILDLEAAAQVAITGVVNRFLSR